MKRHVTATGTALLVLFGTVGVRTSQTPQTPPPAPAPAGAQAPAPAPAGAAGRGQAAGPGQGRGRGANPNEPDFTKRDPVLPLTPEQEAAKFWLPPGFKLEPVLTEPDIQEPAQIAFDGNGRMFVLELRGYMQTADADGELDPVGRISLHEDRDGDGKYETHKVFVDHLIFPRFVMPFGKDAILAKESNADELYKYTDTDGDGTADKKELFATGMGRLANVEHQESGLMWGMDNWLYSTINSVRLRWTPNGVLREPTGSNGGQWGVTQDNYGKPWFQAGASGMPGYFQFPVAYGNFAWDEQFEKDLTITWGAPVLVADMQGGMNAVRMPDGSLARATGAAGNDVFRGDRLPKDMIGDYFYGEAVARIVRRLRPVKEDGLTQLRNVYPLQEFIRSTDPLFRPVDMTTAPDGTMYITDMYRGIVQESQWSGPGTYLRKRIEQYDLDKVVKHGRIWRLTYDGMGRRTEAPKMLDETPAQLVAHLEDPNGWWRDTAQQLLVLTQDQSVVPALTRMAKTSANQLARIHALWTLEGLGAADAALVRGLMKDGDPQIRQQAIRVSETLYKAGDRSFAADYAALAKDADVDVVLQALMTLRTLKVPNAPDTIKSVAAANQSKGVQLVTKIMLDPNAGGRGFGLEGLGGRTFTPEETTRLEKGQGVYRELCFACHGDDGRGAPAPEGSSAGTRAPALAASPRVLAHQDYVIKTLLHGLTGPVNGVNYTEVMIPMGEQSDEWVASVASYIRNAFGNRASVVTPADVARVRAATASHKQPWTVAEIERSLPKMALVDNAWKLTASHNNATAADALTIRPWTSGRAQEPGMWIQVELPAALTISEVQFESAPAEVSTEPAAPGAPTRTGGPGGRGRGGEAPPRKVGYPRAYQVQVSADGTNWGQPVAQGTGTGSTTTIRFSPVKAKFVRITQTGTEAGAPPWSVLRLRLFESGAGAD
jgi:mono/diheme cytochrome c family protein/glucose/arabinose dehydrogenase